MGREEVGVVCSQQELPVENSQSNVALVLSGKVTSDRRLDGQSLGATGEPSAEPGDQGSRGTPCHGSVGSREPTVGTMGGTVCERKGPCQVVLPVCLPAYLPQNSQK